MFLLNIDVSAQLFIVMSPDVARLESRGLELGLPSSNQFSSLGHRRTSSCSNYSVQDSSINRKLGYRVYNAIDRSPLISTARNW